jgi:putative DNA methylase
MKLLDERWLIDRDSAASALEHDFPSVPISQIAEQESWRKELNRPLYHIHKWWATRLGSVFRAIILAALSDSDAKIWESFYKRHNLTGKVVLDPFMGSGTTLGESVKLGAKAIGCDINPVSTFIVRQAFARVSQTELRAAFDKVESETASDIRHYYETVDPVSGKSIPVLYFFWVKVIDTPHGEEIPLFTTYVFAQDAYPRKKPQAQIVCPACWNLLEGRYDSTASTCPHCTHCFNPQVGPARGQYVTTTGGHKYRIKDLLPTDGSPPRHRLYAILALRPDGQRVYLRPRAHDLELYEEAKARLQTEDLVLPSLAVRPGHNTNQARGYNYLLWRDFFNSRQLLCLGLLVRSILRIKNELVQEQLLCLFSSTLEFNNMFCSFKGEGTGAVRHMFSNHILKPERTPLENSVWGTSKSSGTFLTLFESRLSRAKRYLDSPFEVAFGSNLFGETIGSEKIVSSAPIDVVQTSTWKEFSSTDRAILVLNGNGANLPVPDCSVDAVVTDPPYFDFVHYSELSDFFFAWLSPILKDRYKEFQSHDSSHIDEVQGKDPRTFARQLCLVFSECHRVLRPNAILTFSFHHSRPEGWAAIYEAVISAGFSFVAAHPVHAELRASSPKSAAKNPISLDAILVCKKRRRGVKRDYSERDVLQRSATLAESLRNADLCISTADYFVIAASQALIEASSQEFSFDEIEWLLGSLRNTINKPGDNEDPVGREEL